MPSRVETHERVKQVEWTPTYVNHEPRYPTKYKIPKKTKDPFRTLVRDYLTMEQDKDDRQYGGFDDVLSRTASIKDASPGWLEAMKLALPIVAYAEYGAEKCQSMLSDTVDNEELRQGYLAQAMDERRHMNQQLYLLRWMAKNVKDPAGFECGLRVRGNNLFGRAGRVAFDNYYVNDPIESALSLQVVSETAYTNSLFVAMTEVAARNGDHATPGVFLSIQSDEARHMANGYSTLAAVMSEPDNLPMLQKDLDKAFWRAHVFLDPFIGALFDYFSDGQMPKGYGVLWEEWIADDWVGNYIGTLEPFGLQIPQPFEHAAERMQWAHHTAAMVAAAAWPVLYWRPPPVEERHAEWLESQYPGWGEIYGPFWQMYREMADPANGMFPLKEMGVRPPLCRVCSMPCVFPRPDISTARIKSFQGKNHAFCSEPCEQMFRGEYDRYLGVALWDEIWHGTSLDEFIIKNGLLRADGKTLLAQPHLNDEKMWTIDDAKRLDFEILNPLADIEAPELVMGEDGLLKDKVAA